MAEDLTPRKAYLVQLCQTVTEELKILSAKNTALRKRNLSREVDRESSCAVVNADRSFQTKKQKAIEKLNKNLEKYKLLDSVSVGPCNLTLLKGYSIGERIGAETEEERQESKKKRRREIEIEKAPTILKAYVNRMYEIFGNDLDDNVQEKIDAADCMQQFVMEALVN